jgi:hypothetical protein
MVTEKWRTSPRLQGVGVIVRFEVTPSAKPTPLEIKNNKKTREAIL